MGLSRNSSFSMACCVSAVLLTRRFIRASKVEKKCLCTNFLAVFLFRCSILCRWGHRFLTYNPAAQKKSIIFGHATLRRRKNPLFLYMQPCGAEKSHYFWTCNPAAQKKVIIFGLATLRRRKRSSFFDLQPCSAENGHRFLTRNPQAQKTAIVF